MNIVPCLTEPNVKNILQHTLQRCHETRMKYYNGLFNLFFLLLFLFLLGSILIYKYKGKLTPQQQKDRDIKKYQYILEKIKTIRDNKMKLNNGMITNLPNWYAEF